jgi:hypothetical protein
MNHESLTMQTWVYARIAATKLQKPAAAYPSSKRCLPWSSSSKLWIWTLAVANWMSTIAQEGFNTIAESPGSPASSSSWIAGVVVFVDRWRHRTPGSLASSSSWICERTLSPGATSRGRTRGKNRARLHARGKRRRRAMGVRMRSASPLANMPSWWVFFPSCQRWVVGMGNCWRLFFLNLPKKIRMESWDG